MLVITVVLLGPSCGGEPGVARSEHEALLQRIDAMDRRLDALEEARVAPPTAESERLPLPHRDELVLPRPTPTADAAAADPASLKVRVTAAGLEIDGKAVTRADALARFRDVALIAPHTRLTVLSEPDVSYAAVVDALDLAREAGLTDIAMSARVYGEGEGEAPR